MEDLAYRRLLDTAYQTEKPLTKDIHALSRLIGMRDYQSEVADVLNEFFEQVEEGWIHGRVLKEIEESEGRSGKAKQAAKTRWECKRNAQAMQTQCSTDAPSMKNDAPSMKNDATHNTLPITHNTLPISRARGTRLSPDWVLTSEWGNWALQERPDWDAQDVRDCASRFRDHWVSVAGQKGVKADWSATWRNWVRRDDGKKKNRSQTLKQSEAERILGNSMEVQYVSSDD